MQQSQERFVFTSICLTNTPSTTPILNQNTHNTKNPKIHSKPLRETEKEFGKRKNMEQQPSHTWETQQKSTNPNCEKSYRPNSGADWQALYNRAHVCLCAGACARVFAMGEICVWGCIYIYIYTAMAVLVESLGLNEFFFNIFIAKICTTLNWIELNCILFLFLFLSVW